MAQTVSQRRQPPASATLEEALAKLGSLVKESPNKKKPPLPPAVRRSEERLALK